MKLMDVYNEYKAIISSQYHLVFPVRITEDKLCQLLLSAGWRQKNSNKHKKLWVITFLMKYLVIKCKERKNLNCLGINKGTCLKPV